jgi:hypothetical protein
MLLSALGLSLALAPASLPAAPAATDFTVTIPNAPNSYTIDGSTNPTLNLVRGQTYNFNISASGHPFWIKTVRSSGTANAFTTGVTGNGTQVGTLTFVVPPTAPATLFYDCEIHFNMGGTINVTGPTPVRPQSWGKLKTLYR